MWGARRAHRREEPFILFYRLLLFTGRRSHTAIKFFTAANIFSSIRVANGSSTTNITPRHEIAKDARHGASRASGCDLIWWR